jgi:ABC-2 type transport system permease protein
MIGNPWLNYNYYLNPSFVPTLFSLIVMLLVVFSICSELKNGTSRQWLKDSGDSMGVALMGKILPQTFIMIAAGWLLQYMMYCVYHFPLNCNPWHMLIAMALLVIADQGFAVMACCIVPNFRYASIMCTLLGIITFSFGGFSLPQETMYNWVTALGFIMPVKYYFLIYVDQALNGIELYYSRIYYAALILYILIPIFLKWRLKKECYNPVYVP